MKRPGKEIVAPEEESRQAPIAATETFITPPKGTTTNAFTADELDYLLSERWLARLATVGKDGTPHVTPVGWAYNAEHDTTDNGGTPASQYVVVLLGPF
ncbi:MAG: pyridoxamine 5'-phosphate oxidase family protein [Rubrobacter sp.]|nr:pyridoxamine 5'-phosphate oxidase family protein [Rubrobacter sp.]